MFDQSSSFDRGEASELIKNELRSIFPEKNFWAFFARSAHQQAAENSSIRHRNTKVNSIHHPLKLQHFCLNYSTYNLKFRIFILIWPPVDVCHVSNIKVITWWPSHQHLQPGVPLMKYLPVDLAVMTSGYQAAFRCLGQHKLARISSDHPNTSHVSVLQLSCLQRVVVCEFSLLCWRLRFRFLISADNTANFKGFNDARCVARAS